MFTSTVNSTFISTECSHELNSALRLNHTRTWFCWCRNQQGMLLAFLQRIRLFSSCHFTVVCHHFVSSCCYRRCLVLTLTLNFKAQNVFLLWGVYLFFVLSIDASQVKTWDFCEYLFPGFIETALVHTLETGYLTIYSCYFFLPDGDARVDNKRDVFFCFEYKG